MRNDKFYTEGAELVKDDWEEENLPTPPEFSGGCLILVVLVGVAVISGLWLCFK